MRKLGDEDCDMCWRRVRITWPGCRGIGLGWFVKGVEEA